MGTLSSQFCCESKVSLKRKSIFKICARHLMSLRAEIMFQTEKNPQSCVSEWNFF